MRRSSWRYLALLAVTTAGACSDGTSVGDLTEEEARELASAVMLATVAVAESAPDGPPATVDGPAAASYSQDFETEFVAQCPMGGEVAVVASVQADGDDETGEAHVEYSMTQVHEDCVVASQNDIVFTLNGAPQVSVDLTLDSDGEGNATFLGEVAGSIDYDSDQGSGTCPILLEFDLDVSEVDQTIDLQAGGTVCGTSFTQSLTVG